jgi:isoleucyl-tRNA synthetase
MKDLIYKHDSVDDIQMKIMDKEIELWKEDIAIIRIEVLFFKRMLSSFVFDDLKNNEQIKEELINDLNNVKNTNESYSEKLTVFAGKLNRIKEIEGVECESFYLNNYTPFRKDIESHFSAYRFYKINVILFFDTYLEEKM